MSEKYKDINEKKDLQSVEVKNQNKKSDDKCKDGFGRIISTGIMALSITVIVLSIKACSNEREEMKANRYESRNNGQYKDIEDFYKSGAEAYDETFNKSGGKK